VLESFTVANSRGLPFEITFPETEAVCAETVVAKMLKRATVIILCKSDFML
jgi:hypothetical protein